MSSRRRVVDERLYYTPPAMRRHNQQLQLKSKRSSSSSPERRGLESDSNLDRFLEHTTPAVPAQHFPRLRTSVQAWRNRNREFRPYFNLSDLGESFREWSVYGAGVPLVLNGTDSVVQYYVPSLSGIQLYVNPSRNVMYRNCDLTPASWISIAWYPIYRIPVGPTLHNVDACFLTFHSLAEPVTSGEVGRDAGSKLLLPTFGLVSYKFKVSDWNQIGVQEGQKMSSLLQAADNWLQLLQVNHPDYSFFTSHSTYWR